MIKHSWLGNPPNHHHGGSIGKIINGGLAISMFLPWGFTTNLINLIEGEFHRDLPVVIDIDMIPSPNPTGWDGFGTGTLGMWD